MKPAEPFQEFYRADLLPHLEQMEQKRQQIVGRLTRAGFTVGGVTLAVAAVVAVLARNAAIALAPLIIGAIVWAVIFAQTTKGYVAEFKQNVIGRIVTFVDPGLTYQPNACIPQYVYGASQIFLTHPDRYQGEDMVSGTIGQTAIKFSELHSEYKTETTDSKGRRQTHWHTIFKGIFFVADFNKHFQGETVVLPDVAQKLFGRLGQTLQSLNVSRKGDLVRLEDVEFEQAFVVYSDDQVEARYLLSPSLMARIVDFRNRTGHEIYLSFVASNIYVAISHSKNMFEPKLFASVLDPKLAQEYLEDLMLAIRIVEDLNLNTRIWTKQ